MTARRLLWLALLALILVGVFSGGWLAGRMGVGRTVDPESLTDLERQFSERMRGATLVGYFTVTGREDQPARPDRYDFSSVEKIGDDLWRFNARMRHGDTDVTVPFTVPMRWIGDTPVIMMTDYDMPGMGTFSVRLFFSGDRYSGTWQHGAAGGHMFGRIEKPGAAAP